MARSKAGPLDRRIMIQIAVEELDSSGDALPLVWEDLFKQWAGRRASRGQTAAGTEAMAAGGILRQHDTLFLVRASPRTEAIAPESHRVLWHGAIYEIVGISPDAERDDLLMILCSSRPDKRGARGDQGVSGGP